MAKYVGNAFSLQMVKSFPYSINIVECDKNEALATDNTSVVGHKDTANILGVTFNRISLSPQ